MNRTKKLRNYPKNKDGSSDKKFKASPPQKAGQAVMVDSTRTARQLPGKLFFSAAFV